MLIFLLAATLALFVAGVALPKMSMLPPAFWAHLVLAVGVVSLITAAMQHFAPVLTRSRGPGKWIGRLPWLMLVAGTLAIAVFAGLVHAHALSLAALLVLAGAVAMLLWMRRKWRDALGKPHPGLAWYVAAMFCLAAGMVAAALLPWLPQWHSALRAFHLHVNLYGFVGLTAIGTLQVLMPTVTNRPDPEVGRRLRDDLKWALAGSLLLALGKAMSLNWLAGLGLTLWLLPLAKLGLAWGRSHSRALFAVHGQAPVLMAALLGFVCALLAAVLEPATLTSPLGLFLPGFLFPLVSGAAGQLAPVWVLAGAVTARHEAARIPLGRFGGIRALLFLTAALLPLLGYQCAGMPGLVALIWFLAVFAVWLYRE
ncbi:MAG: hypothetical protein IPG66_07740 [Hydrogenophilales bacterium]|nr:hypothetical protein [Hydrogenophilales bacterium]